MVNKNNNKNSSNSLVFGLWPQTKIESGRHSRHWGQIRVSLPVEKVTSSFKEIQCCTSAWDQFKYKLLAPGKVLTPDLLVTTVRDTTAAMLTNLMAPEFLQNTWLGQIKYLFSNNSVGYPIKFLNYTLALINKTRFTFSSSSYLCRATHRLLKMFFRVLFVE